MHLSHDMTWYQNYNERLWKCYKFYTLSLLSLYQYFEIYKQDLVVNNMCSHANNIIFFTTHNLSLNRWQLIKIHHYYNVISNIQKSWNRWRIFQLSPFFFIIHFIHLFHSEWDAMILPMKVAPLSCPDHWFDSSKPCVLSAGTQARCLSWMQHRMLQGLINQWGL